MTKDEKRAQDRRGNAMDFEKRPQAGIEIRKSVGKSPRLVGYAAVFDSVSREIPPGFTEVIRRGAFARTLRERGDEIFAFADHDPGRVLGRRGKNLILEEDSRGLRVELEPINSREGEDIIKNVEAGILDAMSFAFHVHGSEHWDMTFKPPRRELVDVDLFEVSIVAMPAYLDTSIAVRSMPRVSYSVVELRDRALARAAGWR